jgi:hypothetical protein
MNEPPCPARADASAAQAIIASGSRLVRVIGAPESGRTGLALSLCLDDPSCDGGAILVIDTLGHGPICPSPAGRDLIHVSTVDLDSGFAAVRRLLATAGLSAVILDDVLGFDVGVEGPDRLQRFRLIESRVRALASLCLGRGVKLVILDRLSPMGVQRTPIGFHDIIAERSPQIIRNRAA